MGDGGERPDRTRGDTTTWADPMAGVVRMTVQPEVAQLPDQLLRDFVHASDALLCIVDGDGRILLTNPALQRFTGRTRRGDARGGRSGTSTSSRSTLLSGPGRGRAGDGDGRRAPPGGRVADPGRRSGGGCRCATRCSGTTTGGPTRSAASASTSPTTGGGRRSCTCVPGRTCSPGWRTAGRSSTPCTVAWLADGAGLRAAVLRPGPVQVDQRRARARGRRRAAGRGG